MGQDEVSNLFIPKHLLQHVWNSADKELCTHLKSFQGQQGVRNLVVCPPFNSSTTECSDNAIILSLCKSTEVSLDGCVPQVVVLLKDDATIDRVVSSDSIVTILYEEMDFSHSVLLKQASLTDNHLTSSPLAHHIIRGSVLNNQSERDSHPYTAPVSSMLLKGMHSVYRKLWRLPPFSKLAILDEINETSSNLGKLFDERSDQLCSSAKQLRISVVGLQYLLNVVLGLLMMIVLHYNQAWLADQVRMNTEVIVNRTSQLLEWMMGVPAGLKLNHKMTVFLGRFFSYHVWLWAEYVRIVGQHFETAVQLIGVSGLAGFTVQIAILQDLLLVLTLHMQCFYIYSARLYSVIVASLISLWRLFRGKKWNVLRRRVDHGSYDITQLFIGTLLFSILLFILPTAALYYAVFSAFRMSIMTVHSILDKLRFTIHYQYVLIHLMCSTNSPYLRERYKLNIHPSSNSSQVIIELDGVSTASYSSCCSTMHLPANARQTDIQGLAKGLLSGQIM